MDNAGYVGLTRQAGLLRELNTIANNIANISTTGYRREGSVFAEHFESLQSEEAGLSMASMTRRYVDMSDGAIKTTDNPLDFAIKGEAFFMVETAGGEQRLTRDGAFSLNENGEVVTGSGAKVLDESGGAIVIPPEAQSVSVAEDGVIHADDQAVAKLGLVTTDTALLTREGQNLFRTDGEIEPATDVTVHQYALESSNVSAVEELARLIDVQRAYEMSQRFTETDGERIMRTVRTLGQSQ